MWDGHGMLREVVRPDGSKVAFEYDAFARRTKKRLLNAAGEVLRETRYVWDGHVIVHELGSDEDELITWRFEPETFTPIAKEQGARRWAIASDHLGTPTEMVDELGKLAWKMQLDVLGVPAFEEGDAEHCPFRWPGQYEDEETGLYYNRFRYYDPEQGGYTADDPIGLEGGIRLRGYVPCPLVELDPLGLSVTAALRAAMIRAGRPVEKGQTPHHIIQRNGGVWADRSEEIMKRANPEWTRDHSSNGAALWGTRQSQVDEPLHPGRGTSAYHAGNHLHGRDAQERIYRIRARAERAGLDVQRALEQIGTRQEAGKWKPCK